MIAQTITSTKCPAISNVPVKTMTMVYCTKPGTKLSLSAKPRTVHTTAEQHRVDDEIDEARRRADQHLFEHDAMPER